MRIFNGTNSLLTLPLSGNQKLEILPKSVSQEFMGSKEFLSMIVTSLRSDEIAIVVSGVYELNTCANVPTAVNYVVQSIDEAIVRFGIKKPEAPKEEEQPQPTEEKEPTPEETKEPTSEDEPKDEEELVVEEKEVKEEKPVVEKKTAKKNNKKKAAKK